MAYPPLSGLFADRYVIERELGHGATAVVYLARDNKHNRDIALKVLSKDLAHALGPERFLREIQFTTRLHHPHILPIFDSGEWNGMLYYVLPYVRGESLRQKIDRETQLPIEECVRIACEVADALAHAHSQGIVHRDVKPENIMLSEGHALLADFGIARTLDVHTGERLTSSGLIVGTSAYMSPEQAAGEEKIDARSDIYSLACVLYEMIAGVQAFTGPTTQSVIAQRFKHTPRPVSTYRPQVPEYLEAALTKALSISPADRFSTIKKFAAALSDTEVAVGERRRSPLRRFIYGNQKAFGFAAAALVVLSAAFIAANPGDWRTLFSRHAALDSTRYIVVPSPSPGHSEVGAKDLDAVARLNRAMQKWSGLSIVDPQVVSDAVAANKLAQSGDAFELAKRNSAGRLIRVNASGDASVYDVTTATALNDVSSDDVKGASDSSAATVMKLLGAKDRPKGAEGGDGATNSFPAWRAYGEGHAALARNDIAAATRSFKLAASLDRAFLPARLWDAQMMEWIAPADSLAWGSEALMASASVSQYTPRDRSLALGLAALARHDYPSACAEYSKLVHADSADYAAWLGLGECQRLDKRVVRSAASPSGFRFRSSFRVAGDAYIHAVRANPAAYDLIGFSRMRDIKSMENTKIRGGRDSLDNFYGAYPALDHDTVGYVPYPAAVFATIKFDATKRRAAYEKDLGDLLAFASDWVRASPSSAQGFETLATALETRGEIDRGAFGSISASTALSNALRLSTNNTQRVRLVGAEIRLRVKRADYTGARTLSDSLLAAQVQYDDAVADELMPPAALTGRISLLARIAQASSTIPTLIGNVRIPPQVGETAAQLLAHVAVGDCGSAVQRLQSDLDQKLASYFSEKDRGPIAQVLLTRVNSLLTPCTNGRSTLGIAAPDRLQRIQQALARGEIARVRAAFDSLDAARRLSRPGDLSLDYTYQEAWLRAAAGDTAGAIRQLDQTLNALPIISPRTLKEVVGAASLPRAMALRADLAAARGDAATARRLAQGVTELWAGADSELQPQLIRLRRMAGISK